MQSVRFIRKNPLVGWEDMSGLTARQVFEPFAVLMTPGAKAKYEEVYTRVGLPLALLVHPVFPVPRSSRPAPHSGHAGVDDGVRKASEAELARRTALGLQLAKRLNAVVLSLTAREKASVPYYTTGLGKRGSTFRVSPMSPFQLLHRLGDVLRDTEPNAEAAELVDKLDEAIDPWHKLVHYDAFKRDPNGRFWESPEAVSYLSRGVDTVAGRMGVISTDYLSDLWAKWLLTGKVAYSATEPAPESLEEQTARNLIARHAPQIFKLWYEYLMQNRPLVIPI